MLQNHSRLNYRIVDLAGLSALRYRILTFPVFQSALKQAGQNGWIALGLEKDQQPVGLGLAQTGRTERFSGDILSVAVAAPHQRQGLGTGLLRALEDRLQAAGAKFASLQFMTANTSTVAMQRMLKNAAWDTPVRRQLFAESDFTRITKAPWMRRRAFPHGYETFAWPQELTAAERAQLAQNEGDKAWFPPLLNPLHDEIKIDGENSLGLRHEGQLIGWIVAFRLSPDTIRYQKLFVRADQQRRGLALRLLAHSIAAAPRVGVTKAVWDVIPDSREMLVFFERGLRPYCRSYKWSMGAIKHFAPRA